MKCAEAGVSFYISRGCPVLQGHVQCEGRIQQAADDPDVEGFGIIGLEIADGQAADLQVAPVMEGVGGQISLGPEGCILPEG